jgi:hypothetical protein
VDVREAQLTLTPNRTLTSADWARLAAKDGVATVSGIVVAAATAEGLFVEQVKKNGGGTWDPWLSVALVKPEGSR